MGITLDPRKLRRPRWIPRAATRIERCHVRAGCRCGEWRRGL